MQTDAAYVSSFVAQRTTGPVVLVGHARSMAERAGATMTEVAGSHVSVVSEPKVTIETILDPATTASTD